MFSLNVSFFAGRPVPQKMPFELGTMTKLRFFGKINASSLWSDNILILG
jgi:hypothetical protein